MNVNVVLMEETTLVTAVVGDPLVGKSAVFLTQTLGKFLGTHIKAEEIEDCEFCFTCGETRCKLDLFEVSGQLLDFNEIRFFNYRRSDIVLICFSVINPTSFENVTRKWAPELRKYCHKRTPVLLVGTQADLREDKELTQKLESLKKAPITFRQGKALARKIKATKYVECSAQTRVGLSEVFDEIICIAKDIQGRRVTCAIL